MNSKNTGTSNMSFIDKDFQSLWQELLELVPKLTNKWVPGEANESDPLAVLLKLETIFADKNNFNIDKNILELYPGTLTQQESAHEVYSALGFQPDWYISASGQIAIRYHKQANEEYKFTIPMFTQLCDVDSTIIYTTVDKYSFETDKQLHQVECKQGGVKDFVINGQQNIDTTNLDNKNRLYFTEYNIAQNGIFVRNAITADWEPDQLWEQVTNLEQQDVNKKCYKFGVDAATNSCYLEFPSEIGSLIENGLQIKYLVSDGVKGNIIRGKITQFFGSVTLIPESTTEAAIAVKDESGVVINERFEVYNQRAITDGANPLTIEETYDKYQKTINILDTLVTLLDYQNYINTYRDSFGDKIVSNVQVSDRTNDMYQSYKVQTMDLGHNNVVEVKDLPDTSSTSEFPPEMYPYHIRLYPLKYSSDIATQTGFNKTFEPISSHVEIKQAVEGREVVVRVEEEPEYTAITNALSNVQAVTTNYKMSGFPIILTYDLSGKIYLDAKVSEKEAQEIKLSVQRALWSALNSSELNFGSGVSYSQVHDIIYNADYRIQTVALDPISDYSWTLSSEAQTMYNKFFSTYDITTRSILAGITPWAVMTNEDNTKVIADGYRGAVKQLLGQTNSAIYDLSSTTFADYNQIGPDISFYASGNDKYYEVGPNETLHLVTQAFADVKVYSNHLYYTYSGTTVTKPNIPYVLKENEEIYIYETISGASIAKLEKGDIIKVNFELESTSTRTSLYTDKTITKVEPIERTTQETEKIFFSSQELYTRCNPKDNQIYVVLRPTEFVILSDSEGNFTIYEGGTTFKAIRQSGLGEYKPASIDIRKLQETGDMTLVDDFMIPLTNSSGGTVVYTIELNKLYSFGEGYQFKYVYEGDDIAAWNSVLSNVDTIYREQPILIYPVTIEIGSQQFKPDLKYKLNTEDEWKDLPLITKSESQAYEYQAIFTMSVNLGPDHPQAFDAFTTSSLESNFVTHNQLLRVWEGTNRTELYPNTVGSEDKYPFKIQATKDIVAAADRLSLTTEDKADLKVLSYKEVEGNLYPEGVFIDVTTSSITSVVIPGTETNYFIMPVVYTITDAVTHSDISKVGYILCQGGLIQSISDIKDILEANAVTHISNLTSITDGAKYYDETNGDYKAISSMITDIRGIAVIHLTDQFNPTYIPDVNAMILNPKDPTTFLDKNHILNRYTIPKLNKTDNLLISDFSIQK